jgi:recombinational DNA repair protein RecR
MTNETYSINHEQAIERIMAEYQKVGAKIGTPDVDRSLLDALADAIDAMQKQVAVKVDIVRDFEDAEEPWPSCPECNEFADDKYCPNCGQKLDWSDYNE